MKPNFALILSLDGIALLQRSSPGWSIVGEAAPESPELASQMSALRAAAETLSPGTATFKVVVPNDQIRYLSIPADGANPQARQKAVEAALDGTTPYALDELAIDWTVTGDHLQIAAVALETLAEADEFARGYGFTPVSFAGLPEGRDFTGEPFFGTAHDVPENETVEPDLVTMRISGRVRMPAAVPPVEEAEATAPAPAEAMPTPEITTQSPSPQVQPPADSDAVSTTPPASGEFDDDEATPAALPVASQETATSTSKPAPEPTSDAPKFGELASTTTSSAETPPDSPSDQPPLPATAETAPPVAFSSIRARPGNSRTTKAASDPTLETSAGTPPQEAPSTKDTPGSAEKPARASGEAQGTEALKKTAASTTGEPAKDQGTAAKDNEATDHKSGAFARALSAPSSDVQPEDLSASLAADTPTDGSAKRASIGDRAKLASAGLAAAGAGAFAAGSGLVARLRAAAAVRAETRRAARDTPKTAISDEDAFKAELQRAKSDAANEADHTGTEPLSKSKFTRTPTQDRNPFGSAAVGNSFTTGLPSDKNISADKTTAKPAGKGAKKAAKGKARPKAKANLSTPDTNAVVPVSSPPLAAVTAPESAAASGDRPRIIGALTPEERRREEERLTAFGARGMSHQSSASSSVGLVIAILLAVSLGGTVAWAALFRDASLAPLVSGVTEPVVEDVASAGVSEEAFVPPGPGDDDAQGDAVVQPVALPRISPAESDAAETQEPSSQTPPDETDAARAETESAEPVSPLIVTEAAEATTAEPEGLSAEERARYAATGIWPQSPGSIDPATEDPGDPQSAVPVDPDAPPDRAPLITLAALAPDSRPLAPPPPPVFGERFDMDERGMVIATPDGSITPSGVMAFTGQPPILPPTRPGEPEQPAAITPRTDAGPPPADARSQTGADTVEPAPGQGAGVTSVEEPDATRTASVEAESIARPGTDTGERLAFATPPPRSSLITPDNVLPAALTPDAAAPQDDTSGAGNAPDGVSDEDVAAAAALAAEIARAPSVTDDAQRGSIAAGLAAVPPGTLSPGTEGTSNTDPGAEPEDPAELDRPEPDFVALRPRQRPGNISELAAQVKQAPPPSVRPIAPTAASVARQATVRNAIDLSQLNLIGVYGQPSDRMALVRLSNGRYQKVKVGDRIEGGRILAIGENSLRYQKDGRNQTLSMPSG